MADYAYIYNEYNEFEYKEVPTCTANDHNCLTSPV